MSKELSHRIRSGVEASPWVIKEIERLERELAEAKIVSDHNLKVYHESAENLRQQLAASQKQNVMLRDALQIARHGILFSHDSECVRYGIDKANEALAATEADIGGLVLCEGEPVAWLFNTDQEALLPKELEKDTFNKRPELYTPLFRAREQK